MSIHQEVTIEASPAAVYGALTSSDDFVRMTGGKSATISKEVGGPVSLFQGGISGRNVELVPGRRVVQAWRSNAWPEGVYSIIRFELTAQGKGTKLVFDQSGHPDEAEKMLADGWHENYWRPMSAMLSGKPMPASMSM